jgi:hypothetical protein
MIGYYLESYYQFESKDIVNSDCFIEKLNI